MLGGRWGVFAKILDGEEALDIVARPAAGSAIVSEITLPPMRVPKKAPQPQLQILAANTRSKLVVASVASLNLWADFIESVGALLGSPLFRFLELQV